jgi:hypothetical protein
VVCRWLIVMSTTWVNQHTCARDSRPSSCACHPATCAPSGAGVGCRPCHDASIPRCRASSSASTAAGPPPRLNAAALLPPTSSAPLSGTQAAMAAACERVLTLQCRPSILLLPA